MKIYIKKEGLTDEMLKYLGYSRINRQDGSADAGRIGMPHPDITLSWDAGGYREALRRLTDEAGLSEVSLARMLLTDLSGARQIKEAEVPVSDTDLEIISSILYVEAGPLRDGVIRKLPDLEKELSACRRLLERLTGLLEDRIKKAEKLSGNERFFVKPEETGEGHLLFDAALMDFVRNKDGAAVLFSTPVAALDAAYRLEKERPPLMPEGIHKKEEMFPDMSGDYITRSEDGLTYYYDKGSFDPDGSEKLVAVKNREGDIAVVADLSEEEEDALIRQASGIPQEKTMPGKEEDRPVIVMH